jgi:5-methyltetrahydrofolate--homocysteine methyltransferase
MTMILGAEVGPDEEIGAERDSLSKLRAAARERILILDGAMGTQVQNLSLDERDFRGNRFIGCECHLQGNNDLLTLTQPQAIEDILFAYAVAGADILETNTFSSTRIAQADYGMQDVVYELNREARGWRVARRRKPNGSTENPASSRARSVPPTAPPRFRLTSIIPDSAPSPSTICAKPTPSRWAA